MNNNKIFIARYWSISTSSCTNCATNQYANFYYGNSNTYQISYAQTCTRKRIYADSCSSTIPCLENSGLFCASAATGCKCIYNFLVKTISYFYCQKIVVNICLL